MKIHFISFANTASNFSNERIIFEARKMEMFDSLTFYTEKDFDEEFLKVNGSYFEKYKRGYGYWSWKPYIIKKELKKINDGDIIVYADSGCSFIRKNRKELIRWIDITSKSESGILSPCFGPYVEHDWTRGDLYDYINKTYNKDNVDIFDKAIQCGCGISLYMKNEKCVDFVNQWYDVMTNHFHLCTDEPSSLPNHPNFRENRHDQSVFSMLSKIYKIETIETKNGIANKSISPIVATRIKNDKDTWKKPIEILFDNQIFDLQKFGGISRAYVNVKNALNQTDEFDVDISIEKTENEYLKDSYPSGKANNFLVTKERLKKGDFDIFYPTFFYTDFLKYIGDKPYVMSVHDMIPEIYDEYFSRDDLQIVGKKEMVKHAAAIEVQTECTKKDLIRILGVDESKIHVVGRALNPEFGRIVYSKSIVDYDYILYVGQRNAYKRFDWFIKHITPFLENHKDIHIICTGNRFTDSEIEMFKKYGIHGRVHTIFADNLTMATLYRYAKFFVFSSEYEGFGLPVLESYKMGCIALLNNIAVFREITDNQGTFFNMNENESNLSEVAEKVYGMSDEERNSVLNIQYAILEKHKYNDYINKFKELFEQVANQYRPTKDNVDIFVCTHKNVELPFRNKAYKLINCNDINNDTWVNGIKGSFYSEIMSYFYVAENYELKDYVGFCQYRRFWGFEDRIPDMDERFKNVEVLLTKPKRFDDITIREQYDIYHNIDDLNIVTDIIDKKYPEYSNVWNTFLNGKIMFRYNMFIMKKEDFLRYIKFMRGVLDDYVDVVGTDIYKRIEDNKDKYLKDFPPNDSVEYQFRIAGYLAERLTNAFIMKNFKTIGAYDVSVVEEKYGYMI